MTFVYRFFCWRYAKHLEVFDCNYAYLKKQIILDCSSVYAELDVFRGTDRCISVNTTSYMVNNDTLVVDACTKLFGASASLISLPSNESGLWDYLLTHLDA